MDMVLYQFDDGWQIKRVLDRSTKTTLTGRKEPHPDPIFGLYDDTGKPKSTAGIITWKGTNTGFCFSYRLSTCYPKELSIPGESTVEKYWRTFIADTVGEDHVPDLTTYPTPFPDRLLDQLDNPKAEIKLKNLLKIAKTQYHTECKQENYAHYDKWVDLIEEARRFSADIVRNAFTGIFPVSSSKDMPANMPASVHVQTGYPLQINFEYNGWSLDGSMNKTEEFRKTGLPSLLSVWNAYVEHARENNILFVPESKVEVWWHDNMIDGHSIFGLETYDLLDAQSPYTYSDIDFENWVKTAQKLTHAKA